MHKMFKINYTKMISFIDSFILYPMVTITSSRLANDTYEKYMEAEKKYTFYTHVVHIN